MQLLDAGFTRFLFPNAFYFSTLARSQRIIALTAYYLHPFLHLYRRRRLVVREKGTVYKRHRVNASVNADSHCRKSCSTTTIN